jgi:hypothetical protein
MKKRHKNKSTSADKNKNSNENSYSDPKFPYCTVPKSLRKFLEIIPTKPKPPKINGTTLKTWGLKNSNDQSILRVLKKLDFLSSAGEPTSNYSDFMQKSTGPSALGKRIIAVYETLFQNIKDPKQSSTEDLINFFNINSGGGEKTIRFQVDTFKALIDYANFESDYQNPPQDKPILPSGNGGSGSKYNGEPIMRIDLHIHLPENKSKSEYDAIIESIANHLYKNNL